MSYLRRGILLLFATFFFSTVVFASHPPGSCGYGNHDCSGEDTEPDFVTSNPAGELLLTGFNNKTSRFKGGFDHEGIRATGQWDSDSNLEFFASKRLSKKEVPRLIYFDLKEWKKGNYHNLGIKAKPGDIGSVADIDQDHKLELTYLRPTPGDKAEGNWSYLNVDGGKFVSSIPGKQFDTILPTVDWDNDGKLESGAVEIDSQKIYILNQEGSIDKSIGRTVSVDQDIGGAGDIDEDGFPELLVDFKGGTGTIDYRGRKNLLFEKATIAKVGTVADFDVDGEEELSMSPTTSCGRQNICGQDKLWITDKEGKIVKVLSSSREGEIITSQAFANVYRQEPNISSARVKPEKLEPGERIDYSISTEDLYGIKKAYLTILDDGERVKDIRKEDVSGKKIEFRNTYNATGGEISARITVKNKDYRNISVRLNSSVEKQSGSLITGKAISEPGWILKLIKFLAN
ncbi:MAG: FG-GAP repeat domain-containing protein [Candidatus Nanohaloarchaea archaeon]